MILPVFALLFAATLDLGRLFYAQITLTNAAREGAFQGARTPELYRANSPCDPSTNLVVCRVILESRASFVRVSPTDITMSCNPADCAKFVGSEVTVRVRGDFTFVTPLLSPFFGGGQTITLRATAIAQREFIPTPPPKISFPTPPPPPTATPTPAPTDTSGPSPTATATAFTECTISSGPYVGQRGVFPPNVIGLDPNTAGARITAKGLDPVPEPDLTTGQKNKVREQSPDASECVEVQPDPHDIHYKWRP
jgi:TadE-like protein